MFPYIIILIIALLIAQNVPTKGENPTSKKWIWLALVLALFQGLRDSTVGTDTPGYCRGFLYQSSDWSRIQLEWTWKTLTAEPAFVIVHKICRLINPEDYTCFLLFIALICTFSAIKAIRDNSVSMAASVFTFITLAFYLFGFAAARQGIALCIFMLSFRYLYHYDWKRYLVIVFIAALFHKSVLVVLPFCLLPYMSFGKKSVCITVSAGFAIGYIMPKLLAIGASVEERYELYADASATGGSMLMMFAICMAVFFIFTRKYISNDRIHIYDINLHFVITSALVYLVVNMTNSYTELNRFAMYFQVPSIFLYADFHNACYRKRKGNKLLFICFSVLALAYYVVYTIKIGGISNYMLNTTLL